LVAVPSSVNPRRLREMRKALDIAHFTFRKNLSPNQNLVLTDLSVDAYSIACSKSCVQRCAK